MRKNALWVVVAVIIFMFLFSIPNTSSSALVAETQPTVIVQQKDLDNEVKQAVLEAVALNSSYSKSPMLTTIQVTDVNISQDQQWATAWIVYYDPQVDAIIPTEPVLTIVQNVENNWKAILASDPGWQSSLSQTPDDLLKPNEKDMWVSMYQGSQESYPTQSGYFLPWHGGQVASLSRSVGHDADFTTAHYAYDFYMPGTTVCTSGGINSSGINGLNFSLYAARAGTVWGWKDSVANCDHSDVNFIVLQNIDNPSLFQLYMHLAQDSIPPGLKTVGTPVARGQFIGIADNTGASTGSHLHFQIELQPNWPPANPYWRTALDMTFDDVTINGGRPRVSPLDPPYCRADDICTVFQQTYLSGNYYMGDSIPPTGGISGVSQGEVVKNGWLSLHAWGSDGQTGLDYGQLIAFYNGHWNNLGAQFNPETTYNWNLCDPSSQVPNGAVSVAVRLYDVAGNPTPLEGLRHFTKDYSCQVPPQSCVPGPDQVTLFEDPYYEGGCVLFNQGEYPTGSSLNPLGNNDAESIMVGANVNATLYSGENFTGHSQTVTQNIGYMQYAWAPSNMTSSMRVTPKTSLPAAPTLVNPTQSSIFRLGDVIPLSWTNGGGAVDYHIEIYLAEQLVRNIYWQSSPLLYVDSLSQGSYTWRVQGRNIAGEGSWSQVYTFTIASALVITSPETVPFTDTMETSQFEWVNTGQWSYKNNAAQAHSGSYSWWYQNTLGNYDNGQSNYGFLTSPRISITTTGYYLRFYYRVETETQGITWDQRWIQISVDDGPFTSLTEIFDDPKIAETSSWLLSKAIDLSAYAGHIIRVRFQFSTMDADANQYAGWGIDDFTITALPPITCSDTRQDETPVQAFLLTYDTSITVPGDICPNGDYDFYTFFGSAGDRIVADIDAMVNGSPLDSYLFLLAGDGQTVLAENDDEVYAQRRDPLISYTLPESGRYYLKVRAWKHPLVGGDNYSYSIRLYEDHAPPTASISWPASNTYLPDTNMTITAQVSDVNNGVNRVEFYWHPTDWLVGTWKYLGTDWDGSNGWSIPFSPTGEKEGNQAAFYIHAYDMAGNWTSAATWNIGIDKTPPVSALKPLAATQPSNAFLLEWTASDYLSGIDYLDIQERVNAGNWAPLPRVDGSSNRLWIVGNPGTVYDYRMRAVDHSGNSETFPSSAETSTSIPTAGVICFSRDSYDTSGNDNSPSTASLIYADGASQVHNYCNPLAGNFQNDEDWVKLNVIQGVHYRIESLATSAQSASIIGLYAQDGTTLLKETQPVSFGNNTYLMWTSDRDAQVYIRLRHMDGRVIGSGVGTTVTVLTGNWLFLPQVNR